ncbi:DUF397 domain-containing protein [Streptomyces sp. NPDC058751]|uniref:DUF397 domain-containing protein n=1 Tax=Streptomyces sp. NPDC058751 TaxID=3346623 RepID=UPI00368E983B
MTSPDNWQKSSFSGSGDGNNCLELATTPGTAYLRESDTPATRISTAPGVLVHFLNHIKNGTGVEG